MKKSLAAAVLVLCLGTGVQLADAQTFAVEFFNGGGVNYNSRSASLADYDDDGDLDVFFQGAFGAQQLFSSNLAQTGSLSFTNVSNVLPAGLDSGSWSAAWGDYDGDRVLDVFVGQSNLGVTGDVLKGNGASFLNTSASTGLDDPGFHQNVAWNDIDNDNDLDLIIAMEGPERHEIYLQDNGSFTPVGASVGFQVDFGTKAYGMAIGDTDGDGDLDIYISTCRGNNNVRNNFFENQLADTGVLSFVDIADTNGTQFMQNSYGSEFVDFDDDGDLDLYMTGADGEPSKIFRNDGGNQFIDVDTITGNPLLSDTGGDLNGARAVDYDNDGDLDLFFHDQKPLNGNDVGRKLYRNDGNWQFTDVTAAEGLNTVNMGSYDSTWGDLDRDGDQDLLATTNSTWNERLFLSDASTNGNHWLYVELEGPDHNSSGIGATLYATINKGTPEERTLRREANTNAGTFNQSDLPVHFGLGDADTVDELRIEWRDGSSQTLYDIDSNQYLTAFAPNLLPGDYNGDGVVDAADYTVWRDNWLQFTPNGDGDGNGFVGNADYDIWRDNFGRTVDEILGPSSSNSQSVPEPAALLLGLIAGAAAITRRR